MIKLTLTAARVNKKMTQQQAAEKIGICRETLINWESGKTFPDAHKLQTLCDLYDIPMNNILLKS